MSSSRTKCILFVVIGCFIVSFFTQVKYSGNISLATYDVLNIFQTTATDVTRCDMVFRLKLLTDYCTKHNGSRLYHGKPYPGILVDDKHKLMYCPMPKVGSSSLLTLLIHASGKPYGSLSSVHGQLSKYGVNQLKSYPADEIQQKLNDYYKVIVVRHPFDRLISGWYDKIILRKFPKMAEQVIAHSGMDVDEPTFPMFVSYMMDGKGNDRHWKPFLDLSYPCDVAWNAILKMETFDRDYDILLDRFGDDINRTSDRIYRNNKRPNITTHNLSFSRELSEMELNAAQLEFLNARYGDDMDMFGYSWDQTSHTAYCGTVDTCC